VDQLLKKINPTGMTERPKGSGRPRSVRTSEFRKTSNFWRSSSAVMYIIRAYKSPYEIDTETGISRSSVRRIAKHDLRLKIYSSCHLELLLYGDVIVVVVVARAAPDAEVTITEKTVSVKKEKVTMVGDMETRVVESSPTFSETLMPITEVTEGDTVKYVPSTALYAGSVATSFG